MKVALLIFPIHFSHGCILQTYALYSKLKELGCDVTILDRQPNKASLFKTSIEITKRLLRKVFKGYKGAVFYKGWFPQRIMSEQQSFIDAFKDDIISIHSTKELHNILHKKVFDAIVVGSDQTWRPCYVSNVMDYWLEFAYDMSLIKVAYAPSFGVDKWEYSNNQTAKCKRLATAFDAISVREESGVRLCKDFIGVGVKHVLDPTLLWDNSFYAPIAKKYMLDYGSCQCYFLDRSSEKEYIANKVARAYNLKVNFINTRTEEGDAPVKERIAPSIEKWLAGFFYGEFIVVDSFHAMVFSIIFQKPFIVIGNKKRGLSRFESILAELSLEKRLLTEPDSLDEVLKDNINWNDVNERLNRFRNESLLFLREALIL